MKDIFEPYPHQGPVEIVISPRLAVDPCDLHVRADGNLEIDHLAAGLSPGWQGRTWGDDDPRPIVDVTERTVVRRCAIADCPNVRGAWWKHEASKSDLFPCVRRFVLEPGNVLSDLRRAFQAKPQHPQV